jgi:hypothetical protein
VNAELYTAIGLRLKRESPMANTVMVTLANGRADSGYIPEDTALGTSVNLFRIAFVRFHDSNSMVGELIVRSG